LQVEVETNTPNLARLERWADNAWQPVAPSFVWKLQAGANLLRVRAVNQWDRPGTEARVEVGLSAGGK